MNILFISHRIPYPPNKGDKIRSFNQIKYLSRFHRIFLATLLESPSDREYIGGLERLCEAICAVQPNKGTRLWQALSASKPFSVSYFYHKKVQRFIDDLLEKESIDIIVCFCSSIAEYVFQTPRYRENRLSGVRLIMDYVDLDSDKWLQYSQYSLFPLNIIHRIEYKRLFEYEKTINKKFDASIFVAKREMALFQRRYPRANRLHVIPNGVDIEYFRPAPESSERTRADNSSPILVFTGAMDYFANVDGVVWFSSHIFPKIKQAFPQALFYVVGSNPSQAVQSLAKDGNIRVTGFVEDIRDYYQMADICVIPLRIARGLQNKVLEAMASAKAVVATPDASEGIVCEHGTDILIADNAESFAKEVITLLKNKQNQDRIGQNAFNNIEHNYNWEINMNKLDKIICDK